MRGCRIAVKVMTVLFFLAFLAGCDVPKEISLRLDGDREVTLQKGQDLKVELEANPTTGYSWEILTSDGGVARAIGEPEYASSSAAVGAGGLQTFRVRALSEGKEEIKFRYRRPWEKGKEPAIIYTVHLTVL